MIHHSVLGSLERLVAHHTEVHAGARPAWLAPVQVVILPVTERLRCGGPLDDLPTGRALERLTTTVAPRSHEL